MSTPFLTGSLPRLDFASPHIFTSDSQDGKRLAFDLVGFPSHFQDPADL